VPRDSVPLRKALLGAGVLIVHQIGAPEDADALARTLGSHSGPEIARQIHLGPTGPVVRRLLRSRETFLVSPDALSRLAVGEAAVNVRFGEQRLAVVQLPAPRHPDSFTFPPRATS
jgi:hypothetical protein